MAQDILLTEDKDLSIINGDLHIGYSDMQHISDLLIANPGNYRQWPIIGVGIMKQLNGINDKTIERDIKVALEADGAKNIYIKSDNSGISITADYE